MAWFDNIASVGPNRTGSLLSTRRWLLVTGLTVVVFAVLGFFIARGLSSGSPASTTPPTTIAPKTSPNSAGAPPFGRRRFAGVGTIGIVSAKAPDGHSFTIKTASSKTVTVDVSAATTYRSRTSTGLSFSSLVVGSSVVVTGTVDGSTVQAKTVLIVPIGRGGQFGRGTFGRNGGIFGSVAAVNSAQHSFTLTTRTGTTTTIDVDSSTIYRDLATNTTGSFSSIAVGDRVAVTGSTTASGVVEATVVDVVPAGGGFGGGFGPGPGGIGAGNTGFGSSGA